jgi:hypothetical protein
MLLLVVFVRFELLGGEGCCSSPSSSELLGVEVCSSEDGFFWVDSSPEPILLVLVEELPVLLL